MYHATAHSVTRKSPAELIFNRKLRDKLSSLKERDEQLEVSDKDAQKRAPRQGQMQFQKKKSLLEMKCCSNVPLRHRSLILSLKKTLVLLQLLTDL